MFLCGQVVQHACVARPSGSSPSGTRRFGAVRKPAGAAARGTLAVFLAAAVCCTVAWGREPARPPELPYVALSTLPPEAQQTWRRVTEGGPFRYRKDGTVFGNRERLLPNKPRGHYREYTVRTPGSRDRGARRIVCGGTPPTQPETCYYTADHYASFSRIVQ